MSRKANRLNDKEMGVAYALYVADGVSLSGKAQNAIVNELRK